MSSCSFLNCLCAAVSCCDTEGSWASSGVLGVQESSSGADFGSGSSRLEDPLLAASLGETISMNFFV